MSRCTEDQFLKDVSQHEMITLRDDGVYRHIRFKRPGTGCMHFDLLTWPGYLCYSGDMGCYVFSRLEDMFQFFRTDREYARRKGRELCINLGYWSEKLQAVDGNRRHAGAMEFDSERFKQVINEYRVEWIRDAKTYGRLTKEQRRELWDAVEDEVLYDLDEGEQAVFQRAQDFSWSAGRHLPGNYPTYRFEDLWEHRFDRYTFHFTWCCYALAWGINKYDAAKQQVPEHQAARQVASHTAQPDNQTGSSK